ncbi:MAG: hypothetical protein Kow0069_03800 [Promethearchaeota archaeon]
MLLIGGKFLSIVFQVERLDWRVDFTGETALVTGGTSGIGLKLAELLARRGASVAVCSRSADRVAAAVERLTTVGRDAGTGAKVVGRACDVADASAVVELVDWVVEQLGGLRILIANAGVGGPFGPFPLLGPTRAAEVAAQVLGTNLAGTIHCVSAALKHMLPAGYGRILTLSGGGAGRPLANMVVYSASKGGVLAFTRCLAKDLEELGADQVKANAFQPGMHATGLTRNVEIVEGWRDAGEVRRERDLALQHMGGDLEAACSKALPFLHPTCKKSGSVVRGFSVAKMIRGGAKLRKALKKKR